MAAEKLIIFDTTMRDGEQSPGASMTKDEKIRVARQRPHAAAAHMRRQRRAAGDQQLHLVADQVGHRRADVRCDRRVLQ